MHVTEMLNHLCRVGILSMMIFCHHNGDHEHIFAGYETVDKLITVHTGASMTCIWYV